MPELILHVVDGEGYVHYGDAIGIVVRHGTVAINL